MPTYNLNTIKIHTKKRISLYAIYSNLVSSTFQTVASPIHMLDLIPNQITYYSFLKITIFTK